MTTLLAGLATAGSAAEHGGCIGCIGHPSHTCARAIASGEAAKSKSHQTRQRRADAPRPERKAG
jgi:hypothetical protein